MKPSGFRTRTAAELREDRIFAADCAAHQVRLGQKFSALGLSGESLRNMIEDGLPRNRPIGLPLNRTTGIILSRGEPTISTLRADAAPTGHEAKGCDMNAAVQHLHRYQAASNRPPSSRALFNKWLRHGDTALSKAELQQIRNSMSTTTQSEGGYTVPTEVARELVNAMKAYGGLREVATVIPTEGGNPINWPTSDGTAEVGELIAENAAATVQDIAFGTKPLNVYKYSSKVVAVSFELLQDSAIDVEALVRDRLAERLGRIGNTHFTTGTGSGQPNGFITAATVGVTAAAGGATTVSYPNLVDLVHSVDPAYRDPRRCCFMMNDLTLKAVRKILDTTNRPIWSWSYDAGIQGGVPTTLLGFPVVINQDMPVMAANAKSIAFGDFSKYVIRDAMEMQLFRFADSPYIKLGQIGFLAWMRSGGNLIDVNAVKLFVNSAT